LEKFGTDGTRYLLLSAGPFGEDVDVTMERMVEKYNSELANGLGNLVSRVVKLSEKMTEEINFSNFASGDKAFFNDLKFDLILESVNEDVKNANKKIEDTKPWDLVKNDQDKFNKVITELLVEIYTISERIAFFMPETSKNMKQALVEKKTSILFQRIK
jgi:methionyl-tRNA synthetase